VQVDEEGSQGPYEARTDQHDAPVMAVTISTPKSHGLHRRVEGPDVAGRRVLAVEDTSITRVSVLKAVEAFREAGAEVVRVAVIVDRSTGVRELVEQAGLPSRAAYTRSDPGPG